MGGDILANDLCVGTRHVTCVRLTFKRLDDFAEFKQFVSNLDWLYIQKIFVEMLKLGDYQ